MAKMKTNKKIPKFLQSVLWSYRLDQLDLKDDKDIIISQILNYGDWKDLKWLFSVYSEDDIRKVISNPSRGMWFPKALNFWLKMLDLKLPKEVIQKALIKL